ncbi:hypothetical protein GGR88_000284 [Sphingomonas jejuensis]|uniref:SMODS and SLOG-associating 2TM effector domain-containing protein n=1 Tax=Sphingomonas jejuensis TaxID=904715 RepID=A0ABX0XJ98_9SPHN|nr:DUF4231 domain-containing protein [Sphingomonas jejuensis]NJC32810.1 hypothetical protein [Sphingomonas jejuensis]
MRDHGSAAPPRPQIGLVIGVAGHRAIDPALVRPLADRCADLLGQAAAAARRVGGPDAPVTLLSQLAEGADQLAADAARPHGIRVAAVLPFDRAIFADDFDGDARLRFDTHADAVERLWSLPCTRDDGDSAYALAGSAMLGQADMLLALWDGGSSRGPGGTADVVEEAIRRGIPVIHLPVDDAPPRLLWAGIDGVSARMLNHASVPSSPIDADAVDRLVVRLLSPPSAPAEQDALTHYLAERERRIRWRIEYPAMLALARIRSITRAHVRPAPFAQATRDEWASFRAGAEGLPSSEGALDVLERAFSWADRLADHYAQTYRSGVIFNYLAAALAVLVALAGVVAPAAKPLLLTLELLLIGSLILNTAVGNRRQWHRRWLDYRLLAEQLRPMRSLKLLGAGTAVEGWSAGQNGPARWTDWYAASIWREMGLPPTLGSAETARALTRHVLAEEIRPQLDYNRTNAHRMHRLDHRLHRAGTVLFWSTVLLSVVGLTGYALQLEIIGSASKWLTVLGAALPTLGAALFGIRGQSDFAGASRRSTGTADRLARAAQRLETDPITLPVITRAVEDAAATMAADVGEWRTSYLDRKLAIPA